MARQTLLDMTQEILSAMSSDEVNSISDTTESMQVATIIKRKFYDITSRTTLPEHEQLIQLTPSNNTALPILMYIPDEVSNIKWIKYFDSSDANGSIAGFKYVTIVPVAQFIEQVNSFNLEETNVFSYNFTEDTNYASNQLFYYKNDCQPRFCTIISNHYILFDCYDATQDDTLQSSKSMVMARISPKFLMEDGFIPNLEDNQFPLLVNEAKALAFYELKQQPHAKAEQEIKRQWSSVQKNKAQINKPSHFDQLPNFGRHGTTTSSWYGNGWRSTYANY